MKKLVITSHYQCDNCETQFETCDEALKCCAHAIKEISKNEASQIIDTRKPVGLFILTEGDGSFTAIDNDTGDAWTENFASREIAESWLKGEIEKSPVEHPRTFPAPVSILCEFNQERANQDNQWGGAEHDDEHDAIDWFSFILAQKDKAYKCSPDNLIEYRKRFVKIGALALAAIESIDRKSEAAESEREYHWSNLEQASQ